MQGGSHPSLIPTVKTSLNPFMDSSIDSDHSWESHSTGSSGRGTQHSDQGSLGSVQRALASIQPDETDGKNEFKSQLSIRSVILINSFVWLLDFQVVLKRLCRWPVTTVCRTMRIASRSKSHRHLCPSAGTRRVAQADRHRPNRLLWHHVALSPFWKDRRVARRSSNRSLMSRPRYCFLGFNFLPHPFNTLIWTPKSLDLLFKSLTHYFLGDGVTKFWHCSSLFSFNYKW